MAGFLNLLIRMQIFANDQLLAVNEQGPGGPFTKVRYQEAAREERLSEDCKKLRIKISAS